MENGYHLPAEQTDNDFVVIMRIDEVAREKEGFKVHPSTKLGREIQGSGAPGMIYGTLAVVEQLRHGTRREQIPAMRESPHLEFRAIKHNLSWDSARPSSATDQHEETLKDLAYRDAFLDQMAAMRISSPCAGDRRTSSARISP